MAATTSAGCMAQSGLARAIYRYPSLAFPILLIAATGACGNGTPEGDSANEQSVGLQLILEASDLERPGASESNAVPSHLESTISAAVNDGARLASNPEPEILSVITGSFTAPNQDELMLLYRVADIPTCCPQRGLALVRDGDIVLNIIVDRGWVDARRVPGGTSSHDRILMSSISVGGGVIEGAASLIELTEGQPSLLGSVPILFDDCGWNPDNCTRREYLIWTDGEGEIRIEEADGREEETLGPYRERTDGTVRLRVSTEVRPWI